MRAPPTPIIPFLFLALAVSGCIGDDEGPSEDREFPLTTYRYAWEGSDVAVEGVEHGWLLRVTNPTGKAVSASIMVHGVEEALLGPVTQTQGGAPQPAFLPARMTDGIPKPAPFLRLEAGDSGLFFVKVIDYGASGNASVQLDTVVDRLDGKQMDVNTTEWDVTVVPAAAAVVGGDHVQTVTVGVFTNGKSFYTNSADLHADPDFPADYPAEEFGGDPLQIYVYENDHTEQPPGSADTCHFTTIAGYNTLLKTQAAGSTNVALLRPDQAYTRDGNEEHILYGATLVFLNQVIAYDGPVESTEALPNPSGDCFDAQNSADYIAGMAPITP